MTLSAYTNGRIQAVEISSASGLPCRFHGECADGRGGRRVVFQVLRSGEAAFKAAIFARDWHEVVTHGYVHAKLPPAIASVVMSAHGRSLIGSRDRLR